MDAHSPISLSPLRRSHHPTTSSQVFLVFSLVQGVAAAQAGVSVVQPSVGRTREW